MSSTNNSNNNNSTDYYDDDDYDDDDYYNNEQINPSTFHAMRITGIIIFIINFLIVFMLMSLASYRRKIREYDVEIKERCTPYGGLQTNEGINFILESGKEKCNITKTKTATTTTRITNQDQYDQQQQEEEQEEQRLSNNDDNNDDNDNNNNTNKSSSEIIDTSSSISVVSLVKSFSSCNSSYIA